MSVPKNFRLDDFVNALLEGISEKTGKSQTLIVEELIRDHVVFDLEPEEAQQLMQRASEKIKKK